MALSAASPNLPNLYLETSWCGFDDVRWLIDEVGPERVVFGSDAAVDGPRHYVQTRPTSPATTTTTCI